jgi:hypothetical protein
MGVSGLTRENVASHLQKHRMRLKKEEEEGGGGAGSAGHAPVGSGRGAPRVRLLCWAGGRAACRVHMGGGAEACPPSWPGLPGRFAGGPAVVERREAPTAPPTLQAKRGDDEDRNSGPGRATLATPAAGGAAAAAADALMAEAAAPAAGAAAAGAAAASPLLPAPSELSGELLPLCSAPASRCAVQPWG